MKKVFEQLLEDIKKDRNKLQEFKKMAVNTQSYELASIIRSIEVSNFPDDSLPKEELEEVDMLKAAFGLVGLRINPRTVWMIKQVTDKFAEIKDKFDLKAAAKIQTSAGIYWWKEIE